MPTNLKANHSAYKNDILKAMPAEVLDALRPHLMHVQIVMSQVLHEVGGPIDDVYFVEEGLVSLTADTQDAGQVEVGMIGHDGIAGLSALLVPGTVAYHRAFVQAPGFALRMRTTTLREMADRYPAFRDQCLRFQQLMMNEAAQSAACNARHELPKRLARWLLTTCDRLASDEVPMTQEFMSFMLGSRRAGVSAVATALSEQGMIRQMRGRMIVLDRGKLEHEACPCYRLVEDRRQQIMGSSDDPHVQTRLPPANPENS